MASDASGATDVAWFLYTGPDGEAVPWGVTHLRIHPSVTVIPSHAFCNRSRLKCVELPEGLQKIGAYAFWSCSLLEIVNLPEGLQEVGEYAFSGCKSLSRSLERIGEWAFCNCKSLERVDLPATLKVIGNHAFENNIRLSSVDLPDGLEDAGGGVFQGCTRLCNARIPPLMNKIPMETFFGCESMFSLELPEGINRICGRSLRSCHSLRNLAIPSRADIGIEVFFDCKDLLQLFFGCSMHIDDALRRRFDGLPIHKILYYQSYHTMDAALDQLGAAMTSAGQSGNQRDCLGMTPLHILACSKRQRLAIYQVIIEKYPENLITEDRWGGIPLLYALWGGAPGEIIQFLVDSHKSIFPNHELKWGKMLETLGAAANPLDTLKGLLVMQQTHFPEQKVDWDNLLDDVAKPLETSIDRRPSVEVFRFLIKHRISDRVESIGVKQWRKDIMNMIESIPEKTSDTPLHRQMESMGTRESHLGSIRAKLASFECDFHRLKEATTMLELALWGAKINESRPINTSKRTKKKAKIDESSLRNQCRISCGADNVIENVLPYLLPAARGKLQDKK